jgi:hypothetical protein
MKRSWAIEWGGNNVRNPNPRRGGLWVSRTRADTLETTTEQRHVFWGTRWLVTLRWTQALTANAPHQARAEVASRPECGCAAVLHTLCPVCGGEFQFRRRAGGPCPFCGEMLPNAGGEA